MPIKYGELTIIKEKDESILTSLLIWIKNESLPKTKFIYLFDDGEICESENKLIDFNYEFLNGLYLPCYFQKKCIKFEYSPIYFKKNTESMENDFNKIFNLFLKYNYSMNITCKYNCIYYCNKLYLQPDIFALVHIKSTEQMPRYQFAYDSDEFTKEEIIYVIDYIFKTDIN
jgi:hypothetical protein